MYALLNRLGAPGAFLYLALGFVDGILYRGPTVGWGATVLESFLDARFASPGG